MSHAVPALRAPWDKVQELLVPLDSEGLIPVKSFLNNLTLRRPNGQVLSTSAANFGTMHTMLLWMAKPERVDGVSFQELCEVCDELNKLNALEDEPTPESTPQGQSWIQQSDIRPIRNCHGGAINGGTIYQFLGKGNSESINLSEMFALWEGSNTEETKFEFYFQ